MSSHCLLRRDPTATNVDNYSTCKFNVITMRVIHTFPSELRNTNSVRFWRRTVYVFGTYGARINLRIMTSEISNYAPTIISKYALTIVVRKWSAEVPQNIHQTPLLFSPDAFISEKKVLRCSLREHLRPYLLQVVKHPALRSSRHKPQLPLISG